VVTSRVTSATFGIFHVVYHEHHTVSHILPAASNVPLMTKYIEPPFVPSSMIRSPLLISIRCMAATRYLGGFQFLASSTERL
jgi:hypothetical protein